MANKPLKTLNFGGEDTYYLNPEWENIENKPFGETTIFGDTLTWDGNTEGLANVFDEIYRISDKVLTENDFKGGVTLSYSMEGETITETHSYETMKNDNSFFDDGFIVCSVMFYIPYDNYTSDVMEITFPKQGVYAVVCDNFTCILNDYTETVPLPNKYLDFIETVKGGTLTWDGDKSKLDPIDSGDGIIWRISENSPSLIDWQNGGAVTIDGSTESISADVFVDTGAGFYIFGDNLLWFIPNDITDGNGTVLVGKGVFVTENFVYNSLSLTINGYTGFTKTQIKEEYVKDVILAVLEEKGLLS